MATTLALPATSGAVQVDLLSQGDLRIDGAAANDNSGRSVSAGDLNGDGRDDIIIGAFGASNNGRTSSGSTYVVYGAQAQQSLDLTADLGPSRGFRVDGAAAGDQSGLAASSAGDVNGDGRDDIIIGAYRADPNTRPDAGAAYVIYGPGPRTTLDLAAPLAPEQGFRILGADLSDETGTAVAGVGDVNGDGRDDVVVGADDADSHGRDNNGTAYVVYGAATQGTLDLIDDVPAARGFRIDGAATDDGDAMSVAGAGDLNGDGRDDIAIATPYATAHARLDAGSTYVVLGAASAAPIDLAALPANRGFRIDGAGALDLLGIGVESAGDVNGDGRDDLVVGAPGADNNDRASSGSAYVVYGAATPAALDLQTGLTAGRGFRIDGVGEEDLTGYAVDGVGDLDGDGRNEILAGAPYGRANGRLKSGSAYVVYGAATQGTVDLATQLTAARGFRVDGAAADDELGLAVATGDFDGDDRADLLLGASSASNNGRSASGSSYVVSADFLPRVTYPDTILTDAGQPLDARPTRLVRSESATLSIAPALPAGLAFNTTTGRITGTPATPGITSHTVTLTDPVRGLARARFRLGVVNAQGASGPAGPAGADGAAGPAGTNGAPGANGSDGASGPAGANGPAGADGAAGKNGADGAPGPAGAVGPQGPRGRDATVKCDVRGKQRPKVRCKVKFGAATASVRARLVRHGRVYAARTSTRAGRLVLRPDRRLAAGRYRLLIRTRDRNGAASTTSAAVRVS